MAKQKELTETHANGADITLPRKGDLVQILSADNGDKPAMRGFAPQFQDIIDYIVKITHEIWEERAIGRLYEYYGTNLRVHTSSGDIYTRDKVIENTIHALAAFPDRRLYADEVIWRGDDEAGYYTSHRLTHEGHNWGHTTYGPPTGRRVSYRAIADCAVHLAFPFEDLAGPDGLFEGAYRPLLTAVPDLERRDFILMAGESRGANWVGCAGHYVGVMERPFLDIPPTQHPIFMRYHEFFRVEGDRVVEIQAIWDIPQLMMQANAWPMTPSLGVEWFVPGPATQDGIITAPYDSAQAAASVNHVLAMLTDMGKHPQSGGPEVMQLEKYWHPKMTWYGPAGIGTNRRIQGFRNWHQIPFLKAMPDRRGAVTDADTFFGDGNYVGTTGWPNMQMTVSGDGWLGIAPANQQITMRSLDFWRIENGLIRENWVLVDILSVYDQLGVDLFSRMQEMTVARQRN